MKVKVYVVDLDIPPLVRKWALRIGVPAAILVGGGVAFAGLPGGYADGQPLTAAELTSNFNYLQSEITTTALAPRTPSAFRADLTATTNVPNGFTQVVFNNVLFDLGGEYDVATGTFTPKNAGIYLVTCGVQFALSDSTTSTVLSAVIHDGSNELDGVDIENAFGGLGVRPLVTTMAQLAAGDALTCIAYQASGVSQSLDTASTPQRNTFSAARLY